jgi:hypothetical protein
MDAAPTPKLILVRYRAERCGIALREVRKRANHFRRTFRDLRRCEL